METLSPVLAEWQTSEHAVYCGAIENAVAHAAELGGHAVASEVLAAVAPAVASASAALGVAEAPADAAMAAAMDLHVVCRCAARCAHSVGAAAASQGARVVQGLLHTINSLVAAHDAHGWNAPSSCAAAHAGASGSCTQLLPAWPA